MSVWNPSAVTPVCVNLFFCCTHFETKGGYAEDVLGNSASENSSLARYQMDKRSIEYIHNDEKEPKRSRKSRWDNTEADSISLTGGVVR